MANARVHRYVMFYNVHRIFDALPFYFKVYHTLPALSSFPLPRAPLSPRRGRPSAPASPLGARLAASDKNSAVGGLKSREVGDEIQHSISPTLQQTGSAGLFAARLAGGQTLEKSGEQRADSGKRLEIPETGGKTPTRFTDVYGARLSRRQLTKAGVREITGSPEEFLLLKQLAFHFTQAQGERTAFQFKSGNTVLKFEEAGGGVNAIFSYYDRETNEIIEFTRIFLSLKEVEEAKASLKPDLAVSKIAKTVLKSPAVEAQEEEERSTRQALRAFTQLSPFFDQERDTVHIFNVDSFASKVYPEILAIKAQRLLSRATVDGRMALPHTYVLFISDNPELQRVLNQSLPAIPWSSGTKFMYHADVRDAAKYPERVRTMLAQKLKTLGLPETLELDLGFTPFRTEGEEGVIIPFEAEIAFSSIIARLDLPKIDLETFNILRPLISYLRIGIGPALAQNTDKLSLLQNYDPRRYDEYLDLAVQAIVKLDFEAFLLYTRMALQAVGAAA